MTANMRAVLAIVAAMLIFSISDVMMKIVGARMPIGELLLLRGAMASALIVPLALATCGTDQIRAVATPRVLWRSFAEAVCSVLYFIALIAMPLSDAAAVAQFAPLAVMAGAALFLGEPVGWRRWTAAGVGFIGVMLIIKPATSAFQPAALIMMGSNLFVAMRDLITRGLPPTTPTVLVAAMAMLAVTLAGLLMLPFGTWHAPSPAEWAMLFASSLAVIAGFLLTILAMRTGDIGLVSPFRYSFMVFATLASLTFFGEAPDQWSRGGIALILLAGLYSIHRERRRRAEQPPRIVTS